MTSVRQALEGLADEVSLAGLPARQRCQFLLEVGDERFGVMLEDRRLEILDEVGINSTWAFTFTMTDEVWADFCRVPAPRGHTTAQAVVATVGAQCVRGDRVAWAQCALVVDRVLDVLRRRVAPASPTVHPDPPPPPTGLSPITGGYLRYPLGDQQLRIYFEVAGTGIPVVCLHTAGADSRQFRYLLEDEELTGRFRFSAFDLPWHGRSDPPDDWLSTRYTLDTETYAALVLGFVDACQLDRPILVGCSMGGAIGLYLASRHGERFRGVCALEGGLGNPGRFVTWTSSLEVDHSAFLTSWVGGLMSPSSPPGPRHQTLWGYAQSGPGVYQGDTHFYANDLPRYADSLGPATCPLYVFSGEYDYSATTEMSRAAAEQLGGTLVEMPGAGHFPMSEDPAAFRAHLVPVLDRMAGGPSPGR